MWAKSPARPGRGAPATERVSSRVSPRPASPDVAARAARSSIGETRQVGLRGAPLGKPAKSREFRDVVFEDVGVENVSLIVDPQKLKVCGLHT